MTEAPGAPAPAPAPKPGAPAAVPATTTALTTSSTTANDNNNNNNNNPYITTTGIQTLSSISHTVILATNHQGKVTKIMNYEPHSIKQTITTTT